MEREETYTNIGLVPLVLYRSSKKFICEVELPSGKRILILDDSLSDIEIMEGKSFILDRIFDKRGNVDIPALIGQGFMTQYLLYGKYEGDDLYDLILSSSLEGIRFKGIRFNIVRNNRYVRESLLNLRFKHHMI